VPRAIVGEMLADSRRCFDATEHDGALVAVPDALCHALDVTCRKRAADGGRLEAVLEPVASCERTYRLFTQRSTQHATGYRFSNPPPTIQMLRFADVDWSDGVPAQSRLLVTVADRASEEALHRWRDGPVRRNRLHIPSLGRYSRVFLVASETLARRHGRS